MSKDSYLDLTEGGYTAVFVRGKLVAILPDGEAEQWASNRLFDPAHVQFREVWGRVGYEGLEP